MNVLYVRLYFSGLVFVLFVRPFVRWQGSTATIESWGGDRPQFSQRRALLDAWASKKGAMAPFAVCTYAGICIYTDINVNHLCIYLYVSIYMYLSISIYVSYLIYFTYRIYIYIIYPIRSDPSPSSHPIPSHPSIYLSIFYLSIYLTYLSIYLTYLSILLIYLSISIFFVDISVYIHSQMCA